MYSILDKINIAKVSQYLCLNDIDKRGLYGGGVDLQLPNKIYNIRKSVEWLYDNSPDTAEQRAKGYLTITSVSGSSVGSLLTVYVDDPVLGLISLGSYAQQISDTDTTILATNIASALSANTYGYVISRINNVISIEARIGLGGSINDNGRLFIIIASNIFDNSFDNTFN